MIMLLAILAIVCLLYVGAKSRGPRAPARRRRMRDARKLEQDAYDEAVEGSERQLGRELTSWERIHLKRVAKLTVTYQQGQGAPSLRNPDET
jgi:hypothetical protein